MPPHPYMTVWRRDRWKLSDARWETANRRANSYPPTPTGSGPFRVPSFDKRGPLSACNFSIGYEQVSVSDCQRGRPDCKTSAHWHRAMWGLNRHRATCAVVNRPGYPVRSAIRLVLLRHIGTAAVVTVGGLSRRHRSGITARLSGRVFGPTLDLQNRP
jgi:hypothetical protein